MKNSDKVIITCAITGVLTNPKTHAVPVTPKEMAQATREAYDAGASIVHIHFRDQRPNQGRLPTWDTQVAQDICSAIVDEVPQIVINMSTGVMGEDILGPTQCLEKVKPEMAAMNAGSLNYLRSKSDGTWAWDPFIFDNSVPKIEKFLQVMKNNSILPEMECFDTGIVRSVKMFEQVGLIKPPIHLSLVMGVASGMAADPRWLPLLIDEMNPETDWQVIGIGKQEVWPLYRRCIELGGNVRTGLEDTFYLEDGSKAQSNGELTDHLVKMVREVGREVATSEETRQILFSQS